MRSLDTSPPDWEVRHRFCACFGCVAVVILAILAGTLTLLFSRMYPGEAVPWYCEHTCIGLAFLSAYLVIGVTFILFEDEEKAAITAAWTGIIASGYLFLAVGKVLALICMPLRSLT